MMARRRALLFGNSRISHGRGKNSSFCKSFFENSYALPLFPTWIGTIGVSLVLNWNPRFLSSRLKNFVLARELFHQPLTFG